MEPPPDDPLRRHEELSIDRRISGEDTVVPSVNMLAAAAAATGRPAPRAARRGGPESTIKRTADFRLQALDAARTLGNAEESPGTAVPAAAPAAASAPAALAPAAATRAVAGAGPSMAPPVAGTSNWVQMGPTAIPKGQTYTSARVLVTGRVTSIVVDSADRNVIYIGTAQGGVWKTTDGGRNWVAKSDNEVSLAIGALAMDPSNRLVLYAGTGEGNFSLDSYYGNGVLRSTDGGDSWAALATPTFLAARFCRIAVTPGTPARLFAATTTGLYRSTNSGTSWTKFTTTVGTSNATDVAIDPTTPATVYAAFWGNGIYRSTNAGAASPTWTKLAGGLPTTGFSRVAISVAPSSPQTIYALMAGPANAYTINRFMRSTDGGTTWTPIPLTGGNIGGQGFYNLNVAVDPTTPDIVYLSGVSLWRATRSAATGVWAVNDVGGPIHPDNHALAFDPVDHRVVYAGSDGGIYRSADSGATWSDTINEGPCIAQFEFISQHPTSDAVVFGGTQDNGTEQFRNSPVFNHADDGDGGFCAIDPVQPRNVISTYYSPTPKRSTVGGRFGSWTDVSPGIAGGSAALFYPPLTLDQTNASNIALGTDRINLDASQGTGGWPTKVTLPGMSGSVSAIDYVSSSLIYAGTDGGRVYRLVRSGGAWTATAIHAAPLPGQYIWDVAARPDDANTVIAVMSGFGTGHVWRGVVPSGGGATTWTNVSGAGGAGPLPDIPVNALAIDPASPNTYYVGTDVGVFRTTNAGATWAPMSQGLPNCAVFDLRLHAPTRLLRAATHGRGLWERRLDVPSVSAADLYVRDHLMATGRVLPSPSGVAAAFEDPLQHLALGDPCFWWQCADIKVDALEGAIPTYGIPAVADVDYVAFESRLEHRNAQRGSVNRVYVQVHNRGFAAAAGVTVKLLYADASAGLPPLPADFWTAFPGNAASTAVWHPIGAAKVIPTLSATEPVVLEWDWSTPPSAADHSCLLAVMDCPADPIPSASKVLDVNALVRNEKRVGLKNLHVVNAPPATIFWSLLRFFASSQTASQVIRFLPSAVRGWSVGVLLPAGAAPAAGVTGLTTQKPTAAQLKAFKTRFGEQAAAFDTTRLYVLGDLRQGGQLAQIKVPKAGLTAALVFVAPDATTATTATLTVLQEDAAKVVVGGNTYALRVTKQK